ncbi:Vegetative incompatibility protein [Lachnellula occidentalis]|uniref:Vegetative incompatibility protein n=1 Tax=Lachnellula occidentalis TaxID=215460 RepID=A0A8H8UA72_9HELO|nr:Vegetative incompatibility protein [Lachnellula occidentalis]
MADPLSIAGSIAGLVAIADTIFTRIYRYTKAITTLSGLLRNLELVLNEYEEDTPDANLRLHHINSCRETLLKIRNKLEWKAPQDPSSSKSTLDATLRKSKWPFSGPEMKSLLSEVEMHKSTINAALAGDNLSMTLRALSRQDKISGDIKDLKTDLETRWAMETHIALTNQRQEILQFFGKLDPMTYHRSNLNLHHPLTGLWLTEGNTFKTWLHTRKSKLWLSGIPGAGKTVLAACVVEEVMKESSSTRAVAYFYCDYKDSSINIFSSIATQLARQNETAFAHLQKLYEKCHPKDSGTILLEISALVAMTFCFEDVSIVVDGLDECGTSTIDVIISLASLATNSDSNVHEYDIRELLQQEFGHIKIAVHKEDLELYVAAEIDSSWEGTITDSELRTEGSYHKVIGRRSGWHALKSLPLTLFKTYERILERIAESDSSNTLKWIVHSPISMPVAQICEAVSIKESDTILDKESLYEQEDILLYCSSLICLSSSYDETVFELAHFTVKEFLESLSESSGSMFAPYSQAKEQVRPYLAKVCLAYIKLDIFRRDVIEDFDTWKDQRTQYPFRTHAVQHWFIYAKHAWNDKRICAHARELFCLSRTSSFLSWARDCIYVMAKGFWYQGAMMRRFEQVNVLVLLRKVSPLHMASTIGSMGNPIHCALIGAVRYANSLDNDEWLDISHNSMKKGRAEVLDLLIRHGADIFTPYRDIHGMQYSCLKLAVYACMGRGVKHPLVKLVEAGSKLDSGVMNYLGKHLNEDVVRLYKHGNDAASAACHKKEMVEALIASLTKSAQEDCVKSDILTIALQIKSYAAIELQNTTNVVRQKQSSTMATRSLSLAIDLNNIELCKKGVEGGADINSPHAGCKCCKPVIIALRDRKFEIASYLIEMGASTTGQVCDTSTYRGYSAVHLACRNESETQLLIVLLKKDLEAGSLSFQSPLNPIHLAVARNNIPGLKILLQHARINDLTFVYDAKIDDLALKWTWYLSNTTSISSTEGLDSPTATHIAVGGRNIECIKLLLEYGATIDCPNRF